MGSARRCLMPSRSSRCTQSWRWAPSTVADRRRLDCRPHMPRLSLPLGAVNNRTTAVAVYIALADGQCAVGKFSNSTVWDSSLITARCTIVQLVSRSHVICASVCPSVRLFVCSGVVPMGPGGAAPQIFWKDKKINYFGVKSILHRFCSRVIYPPPSASRWNNFFTDYWVGSQASEGPIPNGETQK